MNWFRWHHGTVNDPKWTVIAARAKTDRRTVLAIWCVMLESASTNESERGTLTGWDDEDVAAGLDIPAEIVGLVRMAMQGKVLDGQQLTGWNRRQPKREDNSTERVIRHRANRDNRVTQCNAMKRNVTHGNAVKRAVTPEERRGEENKEIPVVKTTRGKSAPWMGRVSMIWDHQFPGASPPPGSANALRPLYERLSEDEADHCLTRYLAETPATMLNLGKFAATAQPAKPKPSAFEIPEGWVHHDWRKDPLPVFEPGR